MKKTPVQKTDDATAMPFDEAVRRMLAAPPQHKVKPKPSAPQKTKPAKSS
jgi:hypothetical protein